MANCKKLAWLVVPVARPSWSHGGRVTTNFGLVPTPNLRLSNVAKHMEAPVIKMSSSFSPVRDAFFFVERRKSQGNTFAFFSFICCDDRSRPVFGLFSVICAGYQSSANQSTTGIQNVFLYTELSP